MAVTGAHLPPIVPMATGESLSFFCSETSSLTHITLPPLLSISLDPTNFSPPLLFPAKMAECGGLKNIFENPTPESGSPWGQLVPPAPSASFEMFGELCHPSSSSSSAPLPEQPPRRPCIDTMLSDLDDSDALEIFGELCYSEKPSPSAGLPESLASDGSAPISPAARTEERRVEYARSRSAHERSASERQNKKDALYTRSYSDVRPKVAGAGGRWTPSFPPPITTIGRGGKPRVYFKSLRKDGRFVLKEIRIPTQRLLHATRQDGRLTMRVLQPEGEEDEGTDGLEEEDDS